jgi:hypothetical protein
VVPEPLESLAPWTVRRDLMEEPTVETLAETKNFSVWQADEPDGETTYHLELGVVTVHLFREEWEEFLELISGANAQAGTS